MSAITDLLLENIDFGPSETRSGVTIVPLILKDGTSAISLTTAIDQEMVEVLESDSVNHLKIKVANTDRPILLPFLQIVGGGKQDRMLTRPLIIQPVEGEQIFDIPVNCVEQGRWSHSRASTGERTTPRFRSHQRARMSPSVGSRNISSSQRATWASISRYQSISKVDRRVSPSSSYMEIDEEVYRQIQEEANPDFQTLLEMLQKSGELVPGQTGLAMFIGEDLVGLELFGSPDLWKEISKAVVSSFITELRFHKREKKEPPKPEVIQESIRRSVSSRQYRNVSSDQFGDYYMDTEQDDLSSLVITHQGKPVEVYFAPMRGSVLQAMEQGEI